MAAARDTRPGTGVLVAAAVLAWIVVAAIPDGRPKLLIVLSMLVGTSFLGAGIVAWRTRPRNRVGPLMVAVGLAWLPERFVDPEQPLGLITLAVIPLAYLTSLMRRRIDRAGVADLIVRLSGTTYPVNPRDALATTLHDPGLRLGYWVAEQQRYVDADGRPVPTTAPGQVVTRVDRAATGWPCCCTTRRCWRSRSWSRPRVPRPASPSRTSG